MSELNKILKENNNLVVVDFYATWCGPCKILGPRLEMLCKEHNVILHKIDVDELPEVTSEYNVESLPTILFFKNGKEMNDYRVIGSRFDKIKEIILKMK